MPAGPVVREAPYCATDAAGRKAGLHSRRAGRQPPRLLEHHAHRFIAV